MTDWPSVIIGFGFGWVAVGVVYGIAALWPRRYTPKHKRERGQR